MTIGLSVREFAKRDGCSSTLVQRGKNRGSIRMLEDGSLDPAAVGTEWRESTRRGPVHKPPPRAQSAIRPVNAPKLRGVPADATENVEAALAALASPDGVFGTRGEAETVRDSYIAHLRRIEYEQKRGNLIEIEKVGEKVEGLLNQIRTRFIALPAEHAPRLFRSKTVLELQDALAVIVTEILEGLSEG